MVLQVFIHQEGKGTDLEDSGSGLVDNSSGRELEAILKFLDFLDGVFGPDFLSGAQTTGTDFAGKSNYQLN